RSFRRTRQCYSAAAFRLGRIDSNDLQFGFAPDAAMTFSHLSISLLMNAENSSGVIGMGSEPSARIRSATAGSFKTVVKAALSFAITSGGVPAGATIPNQPFDSKPGSPDSAIVGISGRRENRWVEEIATVAIKPASI